MSPQARKLQRLRRSSRPAVFYTVFGFPLFSCARDLNLRPVLVCLQPFQESWFEIDRDNTEGGIDGKEEQ